MLFPPLHRSILILFIVRARACVRVCLYGLTCARVRVRVCMYGSKCVHVCGVCVYVCGVCVCVCVCAFVHMRVFACVHIRMSQPVDFGESGKRGVCVRTFITHDFMTGVPALPGRDIPFEAYVYRAGLHCIALLGSVLLTWVGVVVRSLDEMVAGILKEVRVGSVHDHHSFILCVGAHLYHHDCALVLTCIIMTVCWCSLASS